MQNGEKMKLNLKAKMTVSMQEILYYIFFSLLLLAKGIGLYDGQAAFKMLLIPAVIAWIGKMWLTKYTRKEFIVVVLLVCVGGIVYLISGEKGALLYIFMITGLKNVPLKRVFCVGASVWSLAFIGLTWMNALHLLQGPFKVHEKLGMGMIIRWGLGYSHPNVLHISYFVFVMFLVYLLDERFNLKTAVAFMLGNIMIYIYSVSSTGVIVVSFYLLLNLYWKYRKRLNIIEMIVIQMAFPICVLYSLGAPFLLRGKSFDFVNNITNTRLILAKTFLESNQPTLFGTKLSEIITSQLTMDNSYVFAFVTYGIVLFVWIVLGYGILSYKDCKEQEGKELTIILSCLLGGVTEPFLFNAAFKNFSLLFMKKVLFEEGKEATIHMPGYFYKQYEFSTERMYDKFQVMADSVLQKRKIILCGAAIGIVIGSFAYQAGKQEPQRILVPEKACDVAVLQRTADNLEIMYLASEDDVPLERDMVIGYKDAESRMIVYDGGIVKMEHIRGLLCSGVTMGALVIIVMIIGCSCMASICDKKKVGPNCEKDFDRK